MLGTYPGLFAACHVLLRPLLPRHPPCALCILLHLLFPSTSYALVFFTMGFQLLSHGLLYCAFVFVCLLYLLPSCLACMVEMSGFEPLTPCLQSRCSPAELHPHTFANKHSASTSQQKCIWLVHVRLSACLLFTYSAEEQNGGPSRSRTSDLALIRGTL